MSELTKTLDRNGYRIAPNAGTLQAKCYLGRNFQPRRSFSKEGKS